MKIFEVRCDKCSKKTELHHNSSDFVCPPDWFEILEDNKNLLINLHLCPKCAIKVFSKEKIDNRTTYLGNM